MEESKIKFIEDNELLFTQSNIVFPMLFELNERIIAIYSNSNEINASFLKAKSSSKSILKKNKLKVAVLNIKMNKWEKANVENENSAPNERFNIQGALLKDYIILFGGEGSSGICDDCFILKINNTKNMNNMNNVNKDSEGLSFIWEKVTYETKYQHILKRKLFSINPLSEYCLCYGGLLDNNIISDELFLINKSNIILLDSKEEDIISDDPGPLYAHSSVIINDFLYIYGGIYSISEEDYNQEISNKLFSLNLRTKEWTLVLSDGQSPEQKAYHMMIRLNDESFLIYGGAAFIITPEITGRSFSDDIKLYSIPNKTWYNLDINLSIEGRIFSSFICDRNENIIIFGGITSVSDLCTNDSLDIVNVHNEVKNLKSVLYLSFKEEVLISKEFSFEYENPDFDKEEFKSLSDELISTIKDKISFIENENESLSNKESDILKEIEESKKSAQSTLPNDSVNIKYEDELRKLRKYTDDFTNFNDHFKDITTNKQKLSELLKQKILKMNSFCNKANDLNKEYHLLNDMILNSK